MSLSQPSRTIVVEPLRTPAAAPLPPKKVEAPAAPPEPEPAASS